MRSFCNFVRLLALVVAMALPSLAFARDIVIIQQPTVIYTGPGKFFRPLMTASPGTELPIGKKLVAGKNGTQFHKVLVVLSNGKKSVGYMATDATFAKKSDSNQMEELESMDEYQLSKRAVQVSYSHFKTSRSLASVGYLSFVGPGLYLKGWAGAFKTPEEFLPMVGTEFGSDALIYKRWSGYISATLGVFVNPKENALFPGSKKDLSNFMVQGGVGFRYTTKGLTAISLGGTQAALFNVNNSTVTWGGLVTVEFPL